MSVIGQKMNVTQMLHAATLRAAITVTVWKASLEMDSTALVSTVLLHNMLGLISLILPDVNECGAVDNCHLNAVCTNIVGSYTCDCAEGFTGNGYDCLGNIFDQDAFILVRPNDKH